MILDLFAGPGGWDAAARELGLRVLGIERDDAACDTREAAGLETLQGDVSALNPLPGFTSVDGLIASPPCQAWSMAGNREGEKDKPLVYRALADLAEGKDARDDLRAKCADERSMLVVEPLRWALALEPTWIALEQVPPALELWREYARILTAKGWRVWTGILSAERYGVPQTRRRAILMAHRDRYPAPPQPTHQAYVPGEPAEEQHTLEGVLLPWISMAAALGWDESWETGHATAYGDGMVERHGDRPLRKASEPSHMLTSKVRSWTVLRAGTNENDAARPVDTPAPTLRFGARLNDVSWVTERPPTAVCGDPRISPPGYRGRADDYTDAGEYTGDRSMDKAVRVTEQEAAILQGFPPDYPFQGSRTKRFEQIGNAVPPPLAKAILAELTEPLELEAAA